MSMETYISLWLWYYAGFIFQVITQAQASVSSESNSMDGVIFSEQDNWIRHNWHILVIRLFAETLSVPTLISLMPKDINLHYLWCIYGGLGYIEDSVIDRLLFIFGSKYNLKIELPKVSPPRTINQVTKLQK